MDYSSRLNQNITRFLILVTAMCLSGIRSQTYRKAVIVFPDGTTARNGTLFKIECDFTPNIFPKVLIFQARDKFGNPFDVFSYITQKDGTVDLKAKASMKGRVTLTATRQKFLLEINPILLQDEGNYGCRVFRDFSDQIEAYPKRLNVNAIPSKPVIRISGSGKARLGLNVRLVCTANTGKPAGKLHWSRKYKQDGAFQRIYGTGVATSSSNGTIIETEDFVLNHLRESDDLSIYMCMADNNELRPSEERPTATLTLRVEYPVKGLYISPIQAIYVKGDVIQCGARGNPDPVISWTKLNGTADLPEKDGALTITETSIGGAYAYKCTAVNYVDHYPYTLEKTISFIFRGPPEPPSEFQITDVTAISIAISWVSQNDGGENQTFSIQCKRIGQDWPENDVFYNISDPGEGEGSTFRILNLIPQTIYEFRMRACNPICTAYTDIITGTTKAAPHLDAKDIQTFRAEELITIRWKQIHAQGATYKIKYCLTSNDKCFYHYVADAAATSTAILVGKTEEKVTVYLNIIIEGEVLYTSPPLLVKKQLPVVDVTTIDNATSPLTATSDEVKMVNANTGIIVATVVAFFAMISIGVAVVWFLPKSMRNKMIARLRHMRRRDQGRGPNHVMTVNCKSGTPIPTMPASTTVSDHGDGDRSTLEMEPIAPHIGRNDHHIPLPPEEIPMNKMNGKKDWKNSTELQSKSEVDSLMESEGYGESEP